MLAFYVIYSIITLTWGTTLKKSKKKDFFIHFYLWITSSHLLDFTLGAFLWGGERKMKRKKEAKDHREHFVIVFQGLFRQFWVVSFGLDLAFAQINLIYMVLIDINFFFVSAFGSEDRYYRFWVVLLLFPLGYEEITVLPFVVVFSWASLQLLFVIIWFLFGRVREMRLLSPFGIFMSNFIHKFILIEFFSFFQVSFLIFWLWYGDDFFDVK